MDVQVSFADRIPALSLSARFDGFGALQFDEAAHGIASDAPFWILDCAGVNYMSSIGLRSIVELEKALGCSAAPRSSVEPSRSSNPAGRGETS